MPLLFALALFVSATLLFLVQPMIAKMILPSLGGTPAVWNTCMVFFQAALLAGYAYAHASTSWLGVRKQAALHTALLFLPLLVLPIGMAAGWVPPADANPIPWLLGLLVVSVGLPFFVISASAPLLQKWFASTGHPSANDPYFLYAASNLGSMLALISYPALVEPTLLLAEQSNWWTAGYVVLVALTLVCAVTVWRFAPVESPQMGRFKPQATVERPSWGRRLYWIALAAVPSSLMLGVTTYITLDIAAIPLLWVIPLSLYLLSFILVFAKMPVWFDKLLTLGLIALALFGLSFILPDSLPIAGTVLEGRHLRIALFLTLAPALLLFLPSVGPVLHKAMVLTLPVLILFVVFFITQQGIHKVGDATRIVLHLAVLFVAAMVCHGELARSRPATEYLTEFYLWMSLGGVLGGMFNALVAPLAFTQVAEYPLAMVAACLLLPTLFPENKSRSAYWFDLALAVAPGLLAVGLLILAARAEKTDLTADKLRAIFDAHRVRFLVLAAAAVAGVLAYVFYRREGRSARLLDVVAAVSLGLLSVGLIEGLSASPLKFERMAGFLHQSEERVRSVIMYGLPILLCYTLLARSVRFGLGVGAVLLAGVFSDALTSNTVYRDRSFFGVLNVRYDKKDNSNHLIHGTTLHGMQFQDEDRRREALTYYHSTGPIGQVMETLILPDPQKEVGLIGLGTGTLASYGEKGRRFTFYDIDPHVVHIARDSGLFSYYPDAVERGTDIKIILGDARLRMKEARDGQYGLIVVDAFSSDAIPIHLITKEAMQLYLSKLSDDGVIAFHTSNRYLKLEPVVGNLAKSLNLATITYSDEDDDPDGKSRSTWVLVSRRMENFGKLAENLSDNPKAVNCWKNTPVKDAVGVWTDDYSNLLRVFMEMDKLKRAWEEFWNPESAKANPEMKEEDNQP